MKAYSGIQDGRDSSHCRAGRSIERGSEANITAIRCQQIVGAIRRVLSGEFPLNQEVAMELLTRLIEESPQKEPTSKLDLPVPLSPREVEVLELLARGQSNQQIATHLSISMSTVKNHVHQVIKKLEVSDRVQAAILAIEYGLVSQ